MNRPIRYRQSFAWLLSLLLFFSIIASTWAASSTVVITVKATVRSRLKLDIEQHTIRLGSQNSGDAEEIILRIRARVGLNTPVYLSAVMRPASPSSDESGDAATLRYLQWNARSGSRISSGLLYENVSQELLTWRGPGERTASIRYALDNRSVSSPYQATVFYTLSIP